jgi:hypothetical protein
MSELSNAAFFVFKHYISVYAKFKHSMIAGIRALLGYKSQLAANHY